ncbi:MAG: STAS domain-containing protein [Spirochaetales bacterium]|nr:STAS domain-containing protein [Spirochaetales bacterium]
MAPFAEAVLGKEQTALIVLNRCLEFQERGSLVQTCLQWPPPMPGVVILDLSRLERINVVTISAILRLREMLSKSGGACALRGCSPRVSEALRYLGLHRLVSIEQ